MLRKMRHSFCLARKIGLADKNVSLLFVQEINLSLKV